MSKRHENALFINNGACNPIGIAKALVEALTELMSEPTYTGTAMQRSDPAIRLITNQLAWLANTGQMELEHHADCVRHCEIIRDWTEVEV